MYMSSLIFNICCTGIQSQILWCKCEQDMIKNIEFYGITTATIFTHFTKI